MLKLNCKRKKITVVKKQKPDTRMGYDFDDVKTQGKTRSSLKRISNSKERARSKAALKSGNWAD